MPDIPDISSYLSQRYNLQNIAIELLNMVPGKYVYQITLATGVCWILRMYQVENDQSAVFSPLALAYVLAFLEEQQYSAVRIVRSLDGETVVMHEGWYYLITTFIDGIPFDWSLTAFYNLGAALGKLHALRLGAAASTLPRAGMLPSGELAYAQKQLESVESLVPANLQERYEELLQATALLDRREDLPLVCIHNDCHPANSICTAGGQIQLIDWEGAGSGPAVIDVGFLLASSDDALPWAPLASLDTYHLYEERIAAIIEGYCCYHTLTTIELERLPDALRFRSLVYGACHFASTIAERRQEDPQWWWLRYTAAEEIAMLAKEYFLQAKSTKTIAMRLEDLPF
ncbi:phosphotransferase enzyme family protein [Reticulibacter mediterranei]|nr:phosphotransferase [Reticulibacter mediterranei]